MPEPSTAALRARLTTCPAELRRRLGRARPDDGFVLLEEIVSISLLMIIMAALATFFLTVTQSTTYERSRQSAIQMASTDLDVIRAVHPTDVALGRPNATAQFAAAPAAVQPALATMDPINDSSTSTPTVATPTTRTANNVPFTVTDYLGRCWVRSAVPGSACTNAAAAKSDGNPYVRAVVAVTWSGRRCPSGVCSYVTASLISNTPDPQFVLAAPPPNPPLVADPGPQSYEPGDPVPTGCAAATCLQLSMQANYGVAPATWSSTGTLPPGLTLSTSGLISGTPAAVTTTTSYTFSVTATDAFVRTSPSQQITWTYYPALVADPQQPQTSTVGTAITPLTLTASGGSGGPYRWTDQNVATLPAGLKVSSAGVVSGTPTAAGYGPNQKVTLTVADSIGRPRTLLITWTVNYPPLAVSQADQVSTVNAPIAPLQLKATGGSGSYTWTATNLPAGLTVSSAGVVSGTPTALTASPGTTVTVTATDPATRLTKTATFTWSVVVPPTVTMTTPVTVQAGVALTGQTATFTCPTSSCTFALTGGPTGVGLGTTAGGAAAASVDVTGATSGTLYLVGTPGYTTAGTYTLRITPTDKVSSVAGTAATASWRVTPPAPPTITGLTTPLTTTAGAAVNQALPYTCGTTSCTYTVTGAAAGTGLSTTSGGAPQSQVTVTGTGASSGTIYLTGAVAASAGPPGTAPADVTAAGASNFWRLGETSGTTGADSIGTSPLLEQAGVSHGTGGAIVTSSDGASSFDGQPSDGMAVTQNAVTGPQAFSTSLWFQTTTTSGGKLLGFGNSRTSALSGTYDRHTYMDNAGHIWFGVYPGFAATLTTPGTYNDGAWHQVVATVSGAGMFLYADGALVASRTDVVSAESSTGYWRLGGDNLGGWPGTFASTYYAGALDDVAVYPTALTAAQVSRQWIDGHGAPYTVTASSVDNNTGVVGTSSQAAWTVQPPPAVGGVTALTTTVGAAVSQQLAYSCPTSSCTFAVSGAPAGVGLRTGTSGTLSSSVPVTHQNGYLYLAGTATATGTYTVTVTPIDTPSAVIGSTSQATWTVNAAPTVSGLPGSYALSVGSSFSVPLSYTCPSGSCTYTYTGNPAMLPGIGLSTATSGATALSVPVANSSGTLYLRGTIGTTNPGTYTATVTPVDVPSGVTGTGTATTGTVSAAPTTGSPGAVSVANNTSVSQAVAYSCPLSSGCTVSVSGLPAGVGLAATANAASGANTTTSLAVASGSGTVYLQGRPGTAGTYPVTLTITDSAGSTTQQTATWRVT